MAITLTLADLPPSDTTRWTYKRKGTILQAMEQGLIEAGEVCKRYGLSGEELAEWQAAFTKGGYGALLVTKREPRRS